MFNLPKTVQKETKDFIYHSAIFRGLKRSDAIELAKHLSKYLEVKP